MNNTFLKSSCNFSNVNSVRKAAFEELTKMKEKHSKVNQISYNSFSIQNYLSDAKFTHKEK